MADPFSLAASIAGLIVLGTQTSNILYQFIGSIRTAPDDIRSLGQELTDLCSLLKRLQTALCSSGSQGSSNHVGLLADLELVLDNCMDKFLKLQLLVKEYGVKDGDGSVVKRWRMWRWAFKEKEVMVLKTQLEAHKATLNMALMIATYTDFASFKDSQNRIEEAAREIIGRLIGFVYGESAAATNDNTSFILNRYLSSATSVYSSRPASPRLQRCLSIDSRQGPISVALGPNLDTISQCSTPRSKLVDIGGINSSPTSRGSSPISRGPTPIPSDPRQDLPPVTMGPNLDTTPHDSTSLDTSIHINPDTALLSSSPISRNPTPITSASTQDPISPGPNNIPSDPTPTWIHHDPLPGLVLKDYIRVSEVSRGSPSFTRSLVMQRPMSGLQGYIC